jgi:TRAP transporter TAXI family solute receptor
MPAPAMRHLLLVLRVLGVTAGAALVVWAVLRGLPPRSVTIETGAVGGSYYEEALQYKAVLERQGFQVALKVQPDSLNIIGDVENGVDGAEIGFTAQAVRREAFPHVASAGATELQPLFIFARMPAGKATSPADLRGMRIVMLPEHSATAEAGLQILAMFGVDRTNSRITFMPLLDAAAALRAGQADAGLFMLSPGNATITTLATDPALSLVPIEENLAITRRMPFLRPATLPRGSYDLYPGIPAADVKLVAAMVNVVVRKDISPAVLYTLLGAMVDVHHSATMINDSGDFPTIAGLDLPVHPLAIQYAVSGLPWDYRNLPLRVASLLNQYLIFGIALLLSIEIYKAGKYFGELLQFLGDDAMLRILIRIERAAKKGHPIQGVRLLLVQSLERGLMRGNKRRRAQELMGRIKEYTNRHGI